MGWIPSYKKPDSGGGMPTIVTWSSGTDEEVAAMLQAHYDGLIDIHDYWTVGDERTVSLSAMNANWDDSNYPVSGEGHTAQNIVMVLTNEGGKYLSDGVTECAFQVDQKNCFNESGYMHWSSAVPGWKDCPRRTWCNSIYKNAFPSTLVGIFKEFVNQSSMGGSSSSGTNNTNDYFALRAEIEVYGYRDYSVSGEGSSITWYANGSANQIKYSTIGNKMDYWLRSTESGRSYWLYYNKSGYISDTSPSSSYGIAPFGVI